MKSRKWSLLLPAALALVVWVAWGPLCRAPFLFDDHLVIEKDAWIKGRGGKLQFAAGKKDGALETASPFWHGLWRSPRPVRALTHRIDAAVFGPENAAGPHVVNLTLHFICALLWYALLRRIGRGTGEGAAAALLFAVLPVCAEALGVVSHRKEMLALAPMLVALLLVAQRRDGDLSLPGEARNRARVGWLMALPFFALAVGGKETALVLPALAGLCAWECKQGGGGLQTAVEKRRTGVRLPLGQWLPVIVLGVAGVALFVAAWLQVRASMGALPGGGSPGPGARPGHLPPGTPFAEAAAWVLWALPRYAASMFSLVGHCIDPAMPEGGPGAFAVAIGVAFAAAWCVAAAIALRRRSPLAFPLAWCGIALFPPLFPPLLANGGLAILADRYAYAAAPGAALLTVTAARRFLPSSRFRIVAAVAAIVASASFARHSAADYTSENRLWESALRRNPGSYLAHYNLAFSAWKRGGVPADARAHFDAMARLRPDFAQGLQGYVNFISERDGSAAALGWLDKRLAMGSGPRGVLLKMRGTIRSAGGDLSGAEADFREGIALGLDDSAVRHNLGVVLQRQLRWKEAAAQFALSKGDPRLPDDAALAAALGGSWAQRLVPTSGVSRVVVVGDSVPAGYDAANPARSKSLAQLLNERDRRERRSGDRLPPASGQGARAYRFSNRAVPGSSLHTLPEKLPALLELADVRHCLILSGHNDAFAGVRPAALMRDMADCILICRLRGVEPVVLGPIPVRSAAGRDRSAQERTLAEWNRMLGDFCGENGVRFIDSRAALASAKGVRGERLLDLASGNHLSGAGMDAVAKAVAPLFHLEVW